MPCSIISRADLARDRQKPDPRLHPWRDDLAAAHLQGEVDAPRFVTGKEEQIIASASALRARPDEDAPQDSQLLYGEGFCVYEVKDGWAWGQSLQDDYVGYVMADDIGEWRTPTHKVAALRSFIYNAADIKTPPRMGVSMGAILCVADIDDDFARLQDGGFIYAPHIVPIDAYESDHIEVARRFIGAPYLWGGRESSGLDCSALVQLALAACGHAPPRDSDMQQARLGREVKTPEVGDIVFWQGHVGFLSAPNVLLHANAFHMATVEEDFDTACARIGTVSAIKRL